MDRRTSRRSLLRTTADRAGVPRAEGRGLAGMGPDVSLDGSKDSCSCLLLHVGHLAAAVHPEELRQIQQFALLCPKSEKGTNRVALVLSTQTLAQQSLAKELGLDALRLPKEGNTPAAS